MSLNLRPYSMGVLEGHRYRLDLSRDEDVRVVRVLIDKAVSNRTVDPEHTTLQNIVVNGRELGAVKDGVFDIVWNVLTNNVADGQKPTTVVELDVVFSDEVR